MKKTISLLAIVLVAFSCNPVADGQQPSESTPERISEAESKLNQVVEAAYAVISFEQGNQPVYEDFGKIFTPYATLTNFRNDSLETYSIEDFLVMFKGMVDSGQVTSFHEVEISGETEYFGRIGHRISTYATNINSKDTIAERGVNSFQLIEIDGEWKINSIIWDVEKPGQAIPEKYNMSR